MWDNKFTDNPEFDKVYALFMGGAHCIKIGIYSHIESIGLIQVSSPLWITNLKYIEIIKITKMQELAKILVWDWLVSLYLV